MSSVNDAVPVITQPGQGKGMSVFGDEVEFVITGAQSGGRFTQWIETTHPGGGPPPHYHTREDENFYVIEGSAEFFQGGKWTAVVPGTAVFMPKGEVHAFRNAGETPLKMLITTVPSGFETFFDRCAVEFAKAEGPDMTRLVEIAGEHGIHFVQP
ncbi:MAG: cupin domain-containing protein [Prosthecobacter sp.]|uniref:dimethylsulfonioproprionate lyase family protein n=1 Tax=Prosthecobacter sp. TaxID=1965333 RepID=UPI00260144DD|nr:cupin domain-containing protein [Prosthecobacter sp.]MCF7788183.1 cupin domain-containing protein [Prosthecobacter sp.]